MSHVFRQQLKPVKQRLILTQIEGLKTAYGLANTARLLGVDIDQLTAIYTGQKAASPHVQQALQRATNVLRATGTGRNGNTNPPPPPTPEPAPEPAPEVSVPPRQIAFCRKTFRGGPGLLEALQAEAHLTNAALAVMLGPSPHSGTPVADSTVSTWKRIFPKMYKGWPQDRLVAVARFISNHDRYPLTPADLPWITHDIQLEWKAPKNKWHLANPEAFYAPAPASEPSPPEEAPAVGVAAPQAGANALSRHWRSIGYGILGGLAGSAVAYALLML